MYVISLFGETKAYQGFSASKLFRSVPALCLIPLLLCSPYDVPEAASAFSSGVLDAYALLY